MDSFNLSQSRMGSHTLSDKQIQGYQNGQITIPLGKGVAVLDLKPGDSFQGEIMSVGGEEVQLKLANGQLLAARLEGNIQLAIGQILGFRVQSNQDAKIVLKPVFQNPLQMQVGEAALKTAGIAVNQKNMQLVTSMIEKGLPIDKNNVQTIYRQILQHPQEKMETILQLNKLQMPVTETNLHQYESYQNRNYLIQDSIPDIVKNIRELLKTFDGDNANAENTVNTQFTQSTATGQSQMEEISAKEIPQGIKETEIEVKNPMEQVKQEEILVKEAPEQSEHANLLTNSKVQSDAMQVFGKNTVTNMENEEKIPVTGKEQQTEDMGQRVTENIPEAITKADHFMQRIFQTLDVEQSEIFTQYRNMTLEEKNKWIKSEPFFKKLEETLKEKWSLTPEDIASKEKVDAFYQRLSKQVTQMSEIADEVAKQTPVQGRAIQNLSQNLEFMNELNHVFQYVQLPLKLSDNQAHGELYVYTNKKRLARQDGVITAFLHLDMEHMGPVNVHVSLENQKNRVTTRFEVTPDLITFLSPYMKGLDKRIADLGYQVKSLLAPLQENKTVLQQAQEQSGAANVPLSYQTFDMRA